MELSFRPAGPTDDCRDMIYSAAPELYDYMFSNGSVTPQDYIAHEFQSGYGFIGHRIHTVAAHEGAVVAIGAFYTGSQFAKLQRGSAVELFRFFGLRGALPVLRRANHSASLIDRPAPATVYIANLGVREDMRGHGIGAALIEHETDKARAAQMKAMTLDVADNNPRAEALYRRLGFEVEKEKQFRGDRGARIPNARFMVRPIR